MLNAFDRVVVQVECVISMSFEIQAVRIHGEAVILRRDLDLIALDVQNRMISAVMSELQLVRPAAQSESQNLVPRQIPKIGFFPSRLPHILDRVIHGFRIAGTV